MIIVMQPDAGTAEIAAVEARIVAEGLAVHVSRGTERTLIGAVGDERKLSPDMFETLAGVERALHIVKPYKLVAREWHRTSTVVDVRGIPIGGPDVQVIAGPCSVETPEQMRAAAAAVAQGGARLMRGGAFKPRTSPYTFQGAGVEGLRMLRDAAKPHGLPIVTELMDVRMLDTFLREGVDVVQIGTRNMQNFDLLKEVGRVDMPVILKRGMSATIAEWLMAAEYIAAGGNHRIILCERGIRTFETAYRNVLDVTAIAGRQARNTPAGHRRPVACGRQGVDGVLTFLRRGCRGRGCPAGRGASGSAGRVVRRRPGAGAGRVCNADGSNRRGCAGGGTQARSRCTGDRGSGTGAHGGNGGVAAGGVT